MAQQLSTEHWPRITLVTPSFNQGHYLSQTIASVLSQAYPNLEYIIVDAGSTDSSVGIIRSHAHDLSWWVSEPDSGQTDALMKGFSRCSGELLNWLNADDLLRPGALFAVARSYRDTHADLIVGRDRHFTTDPDHPVSVFEPSGYEFPACLRFWSGSFRYHQPCTFFTRDAFMRAGQLDRSLHYAMDYDFYCRLLSLPGLRVQEISAELSAFRLHEDAKTSRAKAAFVEEMRLISRRYWPAGWSEGEQHQMDRYSAECSVYQAAEAFRNRAWRQGARALQRSYTYDPVHATSFILRRLGNRVSPGRG
jgi:glycosyltransferase involved in cell wall biosynthesis